jgi:hypothetical protein
MQTKIQVTDQRTCPVMSPDNAKKLERTSGLFVDDSTENAENVEVATTSLYTNLPKLARESKSGQLKSFHRSLEYHTLLDCNMM